MSNNSSKIKFVLNSNNDNKDYYEPNHKLYKFHQISQFKNKSTSKYDVRTLVFNENQK